MKLRASASWAAILMVWACYAEDIVGARLLTQLYYRAVHEWIQKFLYPSQLERSLTHTSMGLPAEDCTLCTTVLLCLPRLFEYSMAPWQLK